MRAQASFRFLSASVHSSNSTSESSCLPATRSWYSFGLMEKLTAETLELLAEVLVCLCRPPTCLMSLRDSCVGIQRSSSTGASCTVTNGNDILFDIHPLLGREFGPQAVVKSSSRALNKMHSNLYRPAAMLRSLNASRL